MRLFKLHEAYLSHLPSFVKKNIFLSLKIESLLLHGHFSGG